MRRLEKRVRERLCRRDAPRGVELEHAVQQVDQRLRLPQLVRAHVPRSHAREQPRAHVVARLAHMMPLDNLLAISLLDAQERVVVLKVPLGKRALL